MWFQLNFTLKLIATLKTINMLYVQGRSIIFPTKGVEVTNKCAQYGESKSLRLSDALKLSSKQTKLHKGMHLLGLCKLSLELRTCCGGDGDPSKPPGRYGLGM